MSNAYFIGFPHIYFYHFVNKIITLVSMEIPKIYIRKKKLQVEKERNN